MTTRHGVRLTRMQCEIFDMIERTGGVGVQPARLAAAIYPGVSNDVALQRVRVTVSHINDRLEETDVRIRFGGWQAPYRVVRIKPYDATADAWESVNDAYRHVRQRVANGGRKGFMEP